MIGPFSTDSFIPNMPAMQKDLDATTVEVGLALQLNWIAKGISTLVVGYLSDNSIGRRNAILVSLAVYFVGTLGCACATSAKMFIAMRVLEGLGESAEVACLAVARDVVGDVNARTRILALLGMLQPVAVVCAPVFGGILGAIFGWRYVFKGLAGLGAVLFVCVALFVPRNTRPDSDYKSPLSTYFVVLRSLASDEREAVGAAVVLTAGFSGVLSFLSTISLLLEDGLGVDAIHSSLIIGSIPFLIIATNAFVAKVMEEEVDDTANKDTAQLHQNKMSPLRLIFWSLGGLVVSGFVSAFFAFSPFRNFRVASMLFAIYVFVIAQSLSVGATQAVFVHPFPESAGAAAAVVTFVQTIVSAGIAMIASLLVQKYKLSGLFGVLSFAAFSAQLSRFFFFRRRAPSISYEMMSIQENPHEMRK